MVISFYIFNTFLVLKHVNSLICAPPNEINFKSTLINLIAGPFLPLLYALTVSGCSGAEGFLHTTMAHRGCLHTTMAHRGCASKDIWVLWKSCFHRVMARRNH